MIITMARHLNLYTVAEGVETKDQLDFLTELGCASYQGYYFSKPVEIDEFMDLISTCETTYA